MRFLLPFLALLGMLTLARADDLADAETAFRTLQEYQKTDDPLTLSLFSPSVSVTMLLSDGVDVRPNYLPRAEFFRMLKQELALKKGNKDVYEDVKMVIEGKGVRLNGTIQDGATGKRGPFTILYAHEADGTLKIKELKVTVHLSKPLPSAF